MEKTAWIFSYKLKKNIEAEKFIELTQNLHDEIISKAKGLRTRGRMDRLCIMGD